MSSSSKHIYKVIGIGGEGVKIVNALFERNRNLCMYIACDTDWSAIEASPVPNKVLLCGNDNDKEVIDDIVNDSEFLLLVSVLGGATGNAYTAAIAKRAEETERNPWAVVSLAPDEANAEDAAFCFSEVKGYGGYVQMINPGLLSMCFLYRPKDSVFMHHLERILADEVERIIWDRVNLDKRFDGII